MQLQLLVMHLRLDIRNASLGGKKKDLMKLTEMGSSMKLTVIRESVVEERMVTDNSNKLLGVQNESDWSKD